MMELVPVEKITIDARCQSRSGIELNLVSEYAEAIKSGAEMPPLSAVRSGETYYLYDGFHRLRAYSLAGKTQAPVEYVDGDIWDAIERSCAVNAEHGKRRTNDDKHRAVETMIQVMQHRGEHWSNNEVARRCAVSHTFVNGIRPSLETDSSDSPKTYTDRWGNQTTMNTTNIGKPTVPDEELEEDEADDYESDLTDTELEPEQDDDSYEEDAEEIYREVAISLILEHGGYGAMRISKIIPEELGREE